ncbi:MAG: cytochrome c family protein [Rhizobiaceae bacterium]|nr:MAG: cytochrome c family protein [Rhizobiaceae bacterium]
MDSFEYNKMIGALLGTIFVVFTIALLSDAIFSSPKPEKEGFAIKAEETAAATAAKPAAPVEIGPLLAKADAKKGEQIFHRCEACHDGTKGGPNKVGPNLWGVVGRPIASHPGFSYSAGMKKFSDESKKHWTYQLISEFITQPRKEVPGTAMGFAGLDDAQERADVISFLRTLSDNPEPLPSPEAAKKAAAPADAKAPADGKAPAAGSDQGKAPATAPAAGNDNGQAPAQGTAPKAGAQTK